MSPRTRKPFTTTLRNSFILAIPPVMAWFIVVSFLLANRPLSPLFERLIQVTPEFVFLIALFTFPPVAYMLGIISLHKLYSVGYSHGVAMSIVAALLSNTLMIVAVFSLLQVI